MSPTDSPPDFPTENSPSGFECNDHSIDVKQQKEKLWKAVNDPETAAQDLEIIVSEGCRGLVRRAAEHPRVSLELLIALSQHEDPEVRAAVVDNHQTSVDLHWRLAKDECADVRYAVAESYLVDMDVLSSLLEDANPYISHRARATLKKRNVHLLMAAEFPQSVTESPDDSSDRSNAH